MLRVLLCVSLVTARLSAQEPNDLSVCSAYFLVRSQAPREPTPMTYQARSDTLSAVALQIALPDTTLYQTRLDLAMKALLREMEGDWDLLPRVIQKHDAHCRHSLAKARSRMPSLSSPRSG